jgi:hypothetical protein
MSYEVSKHIRGLGYAPPVVHQSPPPEQQIHMILKTGTPSAVKLNPETKIDSHKVFQGHRITVGLVFLPQALGVSTGLCNSSPFWKFLILAYSLTLRGGSLWQYRTKTSRLVCGCSINTKLTSAAPDGRSINYTRLFKTDITGLKTNNVLLR